jgi:NAD(P)-dependent dehydrogenase (short-subunit alcohol dehydrogenase family)
MASHGVVVFFNGRRVQLGNSLADELGKNVTYIPGDVVVPEDAFNLVDRAAAYCGRINILVNNAGASMPYSGIERVHPMEFIQPLQLHLIAPIILIQRALPHMQGLGRIINIASMAGHKAQGDGRIPYAVSKAALIALTQAMAPELMNCGIRMNSISPGKMGHDYDPVVNTIMYLASDASNFITGADLLVDNGLTCGPGYWGVR